MQFIRVLKTLLKHTKLVPSRLILHANTSRDKSRALFDEMEAAELIRFEKNTGKGPGSGWYYITVKGKKYYDKHK